jgi:peptidyl-prolyl cis-trans isomerase SurA
MRTLPMKKSCKQLILLIIVSICSCAALAANKNSHAVSPAVSLDRIVAIVNDGVVTQNQLDAEMSSIKQQLEQANTPIPPTNQLRHQVLEHLIDQSLQLQLAKKAGIEVSDADVTKAIGDIANRNGLTIDQLRVKIAEQGLNYQIYRDSIQKQIAITQLQRKEIAPSITITDQEVDDMLAALKRQGPTNPVYHIQHILITLPEAPSSEQMVHAKQKADELLIKLRAGANFQEAAVAESGDSQALQGGDLGWRKAAELPEIFANYLKTMTVGDVAGPIRTGNGFHILKLAGIRGGDVTKHQTTQYHIRHILIKTTVITTDDQAKLRLYNLRESIVNGNDFGKVAESNSQDTESAGKGGDLGWINPQQIDQSFVKAVSQLKLHQVSQPIKTEYGWHLIQVLGQRQVEDSAEFLRNQAKEAVYNRKAGEAVQSWIQQLRSQATIKVIGEEKPGAI